MRTIEEELYIRKYDAVQESKKWLKELPRLNFKQEWDVKIIPPFGGAIIRFWIFYKNKKVSVYFDAYQMLGWEDEPYFETYDGANTVRYYMNQTKKMMKDITEFLEN